MTMMKTKLGALVLMAMTSVAMAGGAKSAPTTPTTPVATTATEAVKGPVSDDCARARKQNKTCVLDMGSEALTGDNVKPDGTGIQVIDWGKAGSLIHVRRDFISEIVKTAEDL